MQIFTGILLAFYYQPSATTAYDSVAQITNEVSFGWYFRSLHKWAATLMIAAVILHQMRVYFTAAYRRPRELNWVIGMCLLCARWPRLHRLQACVRATQLLGRHGRRQHRRDRPGGRSVLPRMLLGGDQYNDHTLSRFFILHAAVLPVTMVLLFAIHIAFIRLHGVTELEFDDEPGQAEGHFNFFPDHC